jgi:hypothetical protein
MIPKQLIEHPLYNEMTSLGSIRLFMENHVFSVWLFMCLLESLIKRLKPHPSNLYLPSPNPTILRVLNLIRMDEETDIINDTIMSHLDMYITGMKEINASISEIQKTLNHITHTGTISTDFVAGLSILDNTKLYIISHLQILSDDTPFQSIYSYFTYGREMIIPDMFRRILCNIGEYSSIFRIYLERHIHLDEIHGPSLHSVYPNKNETSIDLAYRDRIQLWDGIYNEIKEQQIEKQTLFPICVQNFTQGFH